MVSREILDRIRKMVLEEESGEKGEVDWVVDWRPFLVSKVLVPADEDIHVGRSADAAEAFAASVIDRRQWREDRCPIRSPRPA